MPVRVKKTRQNKDQRFGSDSIKTEDALESRTRAPSQHDKPVESFR
jgi:hypothetical protein